MYVAAGGLALAPGVAGAEGIPVMEEDMEVEDMEVEDMEGEDMEGEGEDSLQHSIVEVVEEAVE